MIRRTSSAKIYHHLSVEAPITKVISILMSAKESSPPYVAQALDKVSLQCVYIRHYLYKYYWMNWVWTKIMQICTIHSTVDVQVLLYFVCCTPREARFFHKNCVYFNLEHTFLAMWKKVPEDFEKWATLLSRVFYFITRCEEESFRVTNFGFSNLVFFWFKCGFIIFVISKLSDWAKSWQFSA